MRKILITTAICASLLLSSATAVYAAPLNPWRTFIERLLNFFKSRPKPIPPPPPPPVPVPSSTTLKPVASYMTNYGVTTPKENNYFWATDGRYDKPSFFVTFNSAKVNTSKPLYLTTKWSYEGSLVPSLTQTQVVTSLSSNNNMLGAWVSPSNANWTPEPWDGELYHWSVTASWSNAQKVIRNNLFHEWGTRGSLFFTPKFFTPKSHFTTLGGVGSATMKFTVNPEPISSALFLAGGALLASRLRKKRK